MLNLKSKIKRSPDVIFKKVGGQVFLLDPCTSTIHTLNETAGFIWEQIKGKKEVGEIVNTLYARFEVKKKQAQKDTLEWLKKYLKKGLIQVCHV